MKTNPLLQILIAIGLLGLGGCGEVVGDSTAADNVTVLDTKLTIPVVNRQRTIRLYLPPGYQQSTESYPVLYMHDGQNLFDNASAYAGEWQVDESLNQIAQQTGLKLIVVGIDNGQDKRMNELSPWSNEEFGEAEGEAYLDFIINVVRPYINTHYRTLTDRENTAIAGSSMGGLMSHYAIYRRPDVFSKAIIYSPSYWYSERAYSFTQRNPLPKDSRLVFAVGEKEGSKMVDGMLKMTKLVDRQSHPQSHIRANVVKDADHNEAFWASKFPQSVVWLFAQ